MSTLFYNHEYVRVLPFTLLMEERLAVLARAEDGVITIEHLRQVVLELGNVDEASVEDAVDYLASRLDKDLERLGKASTPAKKKGKKGFGTAVQETFHRLEPWEQMVAAWGLKEARRMYCEEDKEDVAAAWKVWLEVEWGRHSMMLEAAAFAAGGGYSDKESNVIDVSQPDGFEAMWKMAQEQEKKAH